MFPAINNYTIEYKINYETKSDYSAIYNIVNNIPNNIKPPEKLYRNILNEDIHNINRETSTIMDNQEYYKTFTNLYNESTKKIIYLKRPLTMKIETDSEGFYYTNEKYNLYVYGENQKQAENNISDELTALYKIYGIEKDYNLDENAKKLKYLIIELIGDQLA